MPWVNVYPSVSWIGMRCLYIHASKRQLEIEIGRYNCISQVEIGTQTLDIWIIVLLLLSLADKGHYSLLLCDMLSSLLRSLRRGSNNVGVVSNVGMLV